MECGSTTATFYETLTTTTTGAPITFTTYSVSSDVISGAFPTRVCAETVDGTCVFSTPTRLAFTYTTFETVPVTLTTNPVITTTEIIPPTILNAACPHVSDAISPVNSNRDNGAADVGPIIGGAIGGAAALLILVSLIVVLWRRNRKMKSLLKDAEEEEIRQGQVNIADVIPSPYPQYPPRPSNRAGIPLTRTDSNAPIYDLFMSRSGSGSSFPGGSVSGNAGHVPPSAYHDRAQDAAGSTYSFTHSRRGSFSAGDPIIGIPPSPTAPLKPSPLGRGSPSSSLYNDPTASTSSKTREAFGQRRYPLVVRNMAEGSSSNPAPLPRPPSLPLNTPVTPGVPPPAYSPGERETRPS